MNAPCRHRLPDVAQHKVNQPAPEPDVFPDAGHDDVANGGRCHDLAKYVRDIFQDDECLGTAVTQLVLKLARGVERIDVDHHHAGAQHADHRDGELRHIGQHDGDPRAARQSERLQIA